MTTETTPELIERLERISHMTGSGLCDNAAFVWKTAMDAVQEIRKLDRIARENDNVAAEALGYGRV